MSLWLNFNYKNTWNILIVLNEVLLVNLPMMLVHGCRSAASSFVCLNCILHNAMFIRAQQSSSALQRRVGQMPPQIMPQRFHHRKCHPCLIPCLMRKSPSKLIQLSSQSRASQTKVPIESAGADIPEDFRGSRLLEGRVDQGS